VGSAAFPPPSSAREFPRVGEWLSLVEHLVRDQGVGGSNPLSPTNLSLASSTSYYAAFARLTFTRFFGTFGTIDAGSSKPTPYSAATLLAFGPNRALFCLLRWSGDR
jgi:hypothetical protein